MNNRTKLLISVTAVAGCVAGSVGYVAWVNNRERAKELAAATDSGLPEAGDASADNRLYAINRSPGDTYGVVTIIEPDGTVEPFGPTDRRCDVLHRGGEVLACLSDDNGKGTTVEVIDVETGETIQSYTSLGLPSRMRVSDDDRWMAYTVFVEGHSYTTPGEFSTDPTIIDLEAGSYQTVEAFTARDLNGKVINAVDRNYWGMSFVDGGDGLFYAALQSNGVTYIIEGDANTRTAQVILEGYGCPSPSPDGKRLIVRDEHTLEFLLHDLETGETTPLPETRLSDDQAEWIDNSTIVYSLPADNPGSAAQPAMDVWSLNVDGGEPVMIARAASSVSN